MATRTKTIEYAFAENSASVASATARNFAQLAALDIPETTGRTFKSVILQLSAWDNGTTAASVTAVLGGVALGAVAISTQTVTFTLTNSGENQGWVWDFNFTSYFATNYTGSSMTADARLTVTGPITSNATAKLIITYEYDDAATTQIKTVRIPIDGNTGNLTTAFTTIGTTSNQIPLLDTFLPESGVAIKSYWFQIDSHTGTTTGVSNSTLDLRYDGSTTVSTLANNFALNSDYSFKWLNVLGSYGQNISTSATHSIEAKVTVVASNSTPCLSGVLYVTYTYNLSGTTTLNGGINNSTTSVVVTDGSVFPATPFTIQIDDEKMRVTNISTNTLTVTRAYDSTSAASHSDLAPVLPTILNSVMLTCIDEAGWQGGTATDNKGRFTREISIQEPGFIDLKQSAVMQSLNDAGTITTDLRIGSQASRTYAHPASLHCGGMTHMRRLDSGAIGGAGMTLTRGFNTMVVDYFSTSATAGNIGSNTSGIMYLNYTSGQHSSGPGVHSHTTTWCIRPWATGGAVQRLQVAGAITPAIPETDYWIVAVSYQLILNTMTTAPGASGLGLNFNCEVQSGEAEGAGWRSLYSSLYSSDAEIGMSYAWARGRTEFRRFPVDPDDTRLDIETARDYRFDSTFNGTMCWQAELFLTYHAITYSIDGSITGSSGGTVTVKGHLAAAAGALEKGAEIASTSRSGNGTYSMTWYDNTVNVFSEAWESSTLLGRSDDGLAV